VVSQLKMDILNCSPTQWYEKETELVELLQNDTLWNQVRNIFFKSALYGQVLVDSVVER
jgi:hypothetical protein